MIIDGCSQKGISVDCLSNIVANDCFCNIGAVD